MHKVVETVRNAKGEEKEVKHVFPSLAAAEKYVSGRGGSQFEWSNPKEFGINFTYYAPDEKIAWYNGYKM